MPGVIRRLVPCILFFTGCSSGDWGFVDGTVSLDGAPLEKGMVAFHPVAEGPVAYGLIKKGAFEIRTGAREGLNVGAYKVTVIDQTIPKVGTDEKAQRLTPERYASPLTTDLIVTIKAGPNPIELPLKN